MLAFSPAHLKRKKKFFAWVYWKLFCRFWPIKLCNFNSHGIADFIFSCEFHVAIPRMGLSKIFDKTIGGEYNSISLHLGRLRQYVFFLFQGLDVRALLLVRFLNRISCNKGLKAKIPWGRNVLESERPLRSWPHIGWRNTKLCIYGASRTERKRVKCWKLAISEGRLPVFISYVSEMKLVSMFYNSFLL